MEKEHVVIYPKVFLTQPCQIGAFVILGEVPNGATPGELELRIGENSVLRSHTTVYAGSIIGANFRSGHGVLVREKCKIGDNVSIGSGSVLEHLVSVGSNVRVHSNCFIPEHTVIKDNVWIGPNVVITNAKYPNAPDTKEKLAGCILEQGCMIGANATILPGIKIGKHALIGAGSVVTKDVEDGVVVAGNPASARGKVVDIETYRQKLFRANE